METLLPPTFSNHKVDTFAKLTLLCPQLKVLSYTLFIEAGNSWVDIQQLQSIFNIAKPTLEHLKSRMNWFGQDEWFWERWAGHITGVWGRFDGLKGFEKLHTLELCLVCLLGWEFVSKMASTAVFPLPFRQNPMKYAWAGYGCVR